MFPYPPFRLLRDIWLIMASSLLLYTVCGGQWTMEKWHSNWHNRLQWWKIFGGGSVTSSSLVHVFTRIVFSFHGKLLLCQFQLQIRRSYADIISKVRIENNCRGWEYLILFAHGCSQCTSVDTPNQHSFSKFNEDDETTVNKDEDVLSITVWDDEDALLQYSVGWVSPHLVSRRCQDCRQGRGGGRRPMHGWYVYIVLVCCSAIADCELEIWIHWHMTLLLVKLEWQMSMMRRRRVVSSFYLIINRVRKSEWCIILV